MTLQEIKDAIAAGKTVHWSNPGYSVTKDKLGQYLISHVAGNCIGLTCLDGTTLNGAEEDFFIPKSLTLVPKPNYCKQCGIGLNKGNSQTNEKKPASYCDECEDDFIDIDLYEDFDG